MSEQKGSTLAQKLANVMAEVCRVPKTGRNDFHKYDYATESDLTEAIRGKLAEQGVAILPSVVSTKSEPLASSKRSEMLTTVTLEITLLCADSGEARVVSWQGQGLDAGDKGFYKAYTGAMKYFLMKTFLISTGDDPEDDGQDRRPAPQRERAPKPERAADQADQPVDEVARWQGLMKAIGIKGNDLIPASAGCAASSKKASVKEMAPDDLRRFNDKLAAMQIDARRDYVRDLADGAKEQAA